ncbi:hypothetical protein V6N13_125767 [Hibiscus sabdariffa]
MSTIQTQRWCSSPLGYVKVSCDASYDASSGAAAAAAVIRNSNGLIIGGATKSFMAYSASIAESITVRLGSYIALVEGFCNVILETDNADLVSRLNAGSLSSWEYASVDRDIMNYAASFSS